MNIKHIALSFVAGSLLTLLVSNIKVNLPDLENKVSGFQSTSTGYSFEAVGGLGDNFGKGIVMSFKVDFNDAEFYETFERESDCYYGLKVRMNEGVLSYSIGDHVKEKETPVQTEKCAKFFGEKLDSIVAEKYSKLKTWS